MPNPKEALVILAILTVIVGFMVLMAALSFR